MALLLALLALFLALLALALALRQLSWLSSWLLAVLFALAAFLLALVALLVALLLDLLALLLAFLAPLVALLALLPFFLPWHATSPMPVRIYPHSSLSFLGGVLYKSFTHLLHFGDISVIFTCIQPNWRRSFLNSWPSVR